MLHTFVGQYQDLWCRFNFPFVLEYGRCCHPFFFVGGKISPLIFVDNEMFVFPHMGGYLMSNIVYNNNNNILVT